MSEHEAFSGVSFSINRDESGKIIDGEICLPIPSLDMEDITIVNPKFCITVPEHVVFEIASGKESPTRIVAESLYNILTGESKLYELNADPETGDKGFKPVNIEDFDPGNM